MKRQALLNLWVMLPMAALLTACAPQAIQQSVNGSLQLTSSSAATGALPDQSGCKGASVSPQLSWSNPPPGTKSLALIMDDQDAIVGHLHRHYYVHWLAFDMPADRHELTEGLARQPLPDGTQQGKNDAREVGYSGPCPNAGSTHHYDIAVYALDTKLGLPGDTTGGQLMTAMEGHILARGQMAVTYSH